MRGPPRPAMGRQPGEQPRAPRAGHGAGRVVGMSRSGKKTLPKSIINGSVPALHAEVPLICSNFAKKHHNK